MFPQRPSSNDNEDDLLTFQEHFLASGKPPSAKFVKCSKDETLLDGNMPLDSGKVKQSDYNPGVTQSLNFSEMQEEHEMEFDKYDTHITKVLSNLIKERDVLRKPVLFPSHQPHAFPQPFRCQKKSGSKKSLFAQQFSTKQKTMGELHGTTMTQQQDISLLDLNKIFPHSKMLHGDGLGMIEGNSALDPVKEIHQENLNKLAKMTKNELLQEQINIRSMLDPKTLEFLQKRAGATDEKQLVEHKDNQSSTPNMVFEEGNVADKLSKYQQKCVGMDAVEDEKMEWMRLADKVKDKAIELPCRFDFGGELLSLEESQAVPSHMGLHHHGEQHGMGGYTLQELLSMTRSEFMQQRVIALKVLAKVISKDRIGYYRKRIQHSLTVSLLDAGFAFLLRWALDDRSDIGIQAAVTALYSILSLPESQDSFMRNNDLGQRGYEQPVFKIYIPSHGKNTQELLKLDLVAGLLSMNLLERIRYILEVCQPHMDVVIKCLHVLRRIATHSMDSASKILNCPRLIGFVTEAYIGSCIDDFSDKKNPSLLLHATQLLISLALSGRHACSRMIKSNTVLYRMITNLASDVGAISERYSEGVMLDLLRSELNVLKLWSICMTYGQMLNVYRDLGQTIILQLQACIKVINSPYKCSQLQWIQYLLKLINSAACNLQINEDSLDISTFGGTTQLIYTIANDTCRALGSNKQLEMKIDLMRVLLVSLDVIATYFNRIHSIAAVQAVDVSSEIETMLHPLVESAWNCISKLSICIIDLDSDLVAEIECLPDLRMNNFTPADVERMLQDITIHQLLSSFLHCCFYLSKCSRGMCTIVAPILPNLASSFNDNQRNCTKWFFNRHITMAMYWALKLFLITLPHEPKLCQSVSNYYSIALKCFSMLGSGDEFYAHDILSSILFHPDLIWQDCKDDSMICDLATTRSTYMACFVLDKKDYSSSKARITQDTTSISSHLFSYHASPLLPADWIFIPFVQNYDRVLQGEAKCSQSTSPVTLRTTLIALKYLTFVENSYPKALTNLGWEAKIARVMCVFMTGEDVFLDPTVQQLAKQLITKYCSNCDSLNFDTPIPGITSFYDFYMSLLEQFEAESYGNGVFAGLVLLPLTQRSSVKYKLALWSEHRDALRAIALNGDQVFVPKCAYTLPPEESTEVLHAYVQAIAAGCCRAERNPFLHHVAVHHIASFIFQQPITAEASARKILLKTVMAVKDDAFKTTVCNYNVESASHDPHNKRPTWNETVMSFLLGHQCNS